MYYHMHASSVDLRTCGWNDFHNGVAISFVKTLRRTMVVCRSQSGVFICFLFVVMARHQKSKKSYHCVAPAR